MLDAFWTRDESEHPTYPVLETVCYCLRDLQLLTCCNQTHGQHSTQVFFPFQFNRKNPLLFSKSNKERVSKQQLFPSLETMTAAIRWKKQGKEGHKARIPQFPDLFMKLLLTAISWSLFPLLCVQNRKCTQKESWENFLFHYFQDVRGKGLKKENQASLFIMHYKTTCKVFSI